MRSLKFLVGLALLPCCWAITRTLLALVRAVQPDSFAGVSDTTWALVIGFCLWVLLYLTLPRPVRTYVLAHELTHALWGLVMGARVSRMKVSGKGGYVQLSKTNFLITLAPYFFPFYTVLVLAGYGLLSLFFDLSTYRLFFLGLVGLTWAFHFTFTLSTLREHQEDIREGGRLFSYTVIYFLNLVALCLCIVSVGRPTLEDGLAQWNRDFRSTWSRLVTLLPGPKEEARRAETSGLTV